LPAVGEFEDQLRVGQLARFSDRGSIGIDATGDGSPEGELSGKGALTPLTAVVHLLMIARTKSSSSSRIASRVVGTGTPWSVRFQSMMRSARKLDGGLGAVLSLLAVAGADGEELLHAEGPDADFEARVFAVLELQVVHLRVALVAHGFLLCRMGLVEYRRGQAQVGTFRRRGRPARRR
jgi:hypothetical protein